MVTQCGFALGFQAARERSKKTEAVFLGALRESEGKSKSPQAPFFFCQRFLFWRGKKENAEKHRSYKSKVPFPSSPLEGNYKGVKFNPTLSCTKLTNRLLHPCSSLFVSLSSPIFGRTARKTQVRRPMPAALRCRAPAQNRTYARTASQAAHSAALFAAAYHRAHAA